MEDDEPLFAILAVTMAILSAAFVAMLMWGQR